MTDLPQSNPAHKTSSMLRLESPIQGTVVAVAASADQVVATHAPIVIVESMKMEHAVEAPTTCRIAEILVAVGEQVAAGQALAVLQPEDPANAIDTDTATSDPQRIPDSLRELIERKGATLDAARPDAVAKRHGYGHLMAREWLDLLLDEGTFVEYGSFPVAAQRSRRTLEDLVTNTPADGLLTGLGRIDGDEVAVLAYDYTVLAGTQGYFNHRKTDRMLTVARDRRSPVVLFAEGGGGRPGDVDAGALIAAGLNVTSFALMGSLSGLVPTVGIVTGRCFAGNAALLGCCDVTIATRDSNIGMAGPAMIEGGGLGRFSPTDIGPIDVQADNGVVDVVVDSDDEAIDCAKRFLSYARGHVREWTADDQNLLRRAVGENRKAAYDQRSLIALLADRESVMELRRDFGAGIITAFMRVEGIPMGLIANDPAHLGGAIDTDAADKMAEFMRLCDGYGLPIVSLCDTPGFMVGPDSEANAAVRRFSRLFVVGAQLRVPMVTVIIRKGYGLGAQAMAGGSFSSPTATVAWPTGEIGGMGLEGAVRLGFAKELEAIDDPVEREKAFESLVAAHYEMGKAINGAMKHEFDEVIDPADTRRWIVATVGRVHGRQGGRRAQDSGDTHV